MILQAVLVASFATVALGSICCAPSQWEGYQFTYGEYSKVQKRPGTTGLPEEKFGRYRVSYDADNKRVASYGNYTRNGQLITFRAINDYVKGRGYFVLPQQKICTSFDLPTEFPQACIPDEAVSVGPFALGIDQNILTFDSYKVRNTKGANDVTTIVGVLQQGCVPGVENVYGTIRGVRFFSSVSFNDMTTGIKDGSVFNEPDYCVEGPVQQLDFLHLGTTVMAL